MLTKYTENINHSFPFPDVPSLRLLPCRECPPRLSKPPSCVHDKYAEVLSCCIVGASFSIRESTAHLIIALLYVCLCFYPLFVPSSPQWNFQDKARLDPASFNDIQAAITPEDISYQASHYYSFQSSQLAKTDGSFFPPGECTAPPSFMKVSQCDDASISGVVYFFQVLFQICAVFTIRVLPLSSGE